MTNAKPLTISSLADAADDRAQAESAFKTLLSQIPFKDINKSRVDVLIGVGSIDVALQDLLLKKLTQSVNDNDELLSEGMPLGSFMLRAKLALRVGLVSSDLYSILKSLSKIRNISAHSGQQIDVFARDDVKQSVLNIWSRLDKEFTANPVSSIEIKFNTICDLVKVSLILNERNTESVLTRSKEIIFKK